MNKNRYSLMEVPLLLPSLPKEADALFAAVHAAGGHAYVVGGALRDLLRGFPPQDWDFAATLPTGALLAALPGARLVGGACGTVQVPFGALLFEVTPCRTEGAYSDHRHPDEVRFVPDIRADLARRDFTVNAMAFDGRELLDPFGGRKDLEDRLLRCVGRPQQRFAEDPLRILRLFRFAAVLAFAPEEATLAAALAAAGSIGTLSAPRVRAEMELLLQATAPQALESLLQAGGLGAYGLSFSSPLAPLANVPPGRLYRWWALLQLCGANTAAVGEAFGFSRRFMASLQQCRRLYHLGPAKDKLALKRKLWDIQLSYRSLAAAFAALSPAFANEPALFSALEAAGEPYRIKDLAVNGDMLHHAGLRGEQCGRVLQELVAVVIKDPALNDARVLMGIARQLAEIL